MTRYSQTRQEAIELTTPLSPGTPLIKPSRLLSQKKPILIGTWNVRTLWEAGKCAQAVAEMNRYKLTLMGMCETRWNGHGETKLQTGETLIYSGKDISDHHEAGVGILLSKTAAKSLLEWEPVSDRIITARFSSRFQKVTLVMCYAPTNTTEEEIKENYYAQLQTVVDKIPNRDMLIIMGDMNAKVGSINTDREHEMGKHGIGQMNENGELLADFCTVNNLVIGGTLFPHKRCHIATWVSPDHQTENRSTIFC